VWSGEKARARKLVDEHIAHFIIPENPDVIVDLVQGTQTP
jgi:hypothetical protein